MQSIFRVANKRGQCYKNGKHADSERRAVEPKCLASYGGMEVQFTATPRQNVYQERELNYSTFIHVIFLLHEDSLERLPETTLLDHYA
jgi:hypothetical protein